MTRPIGTPSGASASASSSSAQGPSSGWPAHPGSTIEHDPYPQAVALGERRPNVPILKSTPFWVASSLVVLAILGVVLTELGKPGKTAGSGKSANSATTTPTTPATTRPAPTTTLPAIPVAPQPTADEAATALIANWGAGNRTVALSVATTQAVDNLFAAPYQAGLAIDRGCSNGTPPVTCTFGPPGGANPNDPIYSLSVSQAPNGGWYVSAAQVEG